ncbi:MAG: hypothetical protein JSS40_05335 [Proteobacteria bacterium]|nr:hypothetical protein [Pseudomonadota bacterium]
MNSAPMSGALTRTGLWATLAFASNLAWEIGHVRLYTLWMEADGPRIAWSVLHCSLGDVVIALAAYALAGVALRRADWPSSQPWSGGAIATACAVAYTAWSEWYNVYRVAAWGYTPDMPTVYGIGLTPLLQWLVIPPALVITHRALLKKPR